MPSEQVALDTSTEAQQRLRPHVIPGTDSIPYPPSTPDSLSGVTITVPGQSVGACLPDLETADNFTWEGSVLASSASIFWSLVAVMVKLSPSLSTSKLVFHFSLGVFVGITTCESRLSVYDPLSAQHELLTRSILVTLIVIARFLSLRYLSLMNSHALSNVGPALTLIPEYLAGGSKGLTAGRIFAVVVMGVGVSLIIHTNLTQDHATAQNFRVGCALALTSAFLKALVRELNPCANIPTATQIFHWSFVALLTSCGMAAWNGEIGGIFGDADMGALVFVAQVSFAYVYFVNKASEMENHGVVNMWLCSGDLVLAIVASLVYLREDMRPLSYVAAALILASVLSAEASKLSVVSRRPRA